MKKILWTITVTVIIIALSSLAFPADTASADDREQMRTRTYEREYIYGSQLMTEQEREQFRHKMRTAKTDEERERIRYEHHDQMMERAREQGVTLPDEPYEHGMGQGMGSGGGMGHGGKGMGKMGK